MIKNTSINTYLKIIFKQIFFLPVLVIIFFILGSFNKTERVYAQYLSPNNTVMVEGLSVVKDDNRANARIKAISNAMENALTETLINLLNYATYLEHENEMEKFILKKREYYVQSYKILAEYLDITANTYRVISEISFFKNDLKKDLAKKGLLFKGKDISQIVIIIDESRAGETFNYTNFWANKSFVEQGLKDTLAAQGLTVLAREELDKKLNQSTVFMAINGNRNAIIDIGIRNNAEVVIIGNSVLKYNTLETIEHHKNPININISLQVLRADNGALLTDLEKNIDAQVDENKKDIQSVLFSVGEKISEPLLKKITDAWQKHIKKALP